MPDHAMEFKRPSCLSRVRILATCAGVTLFATVGCSSSSAGRQAATSPSSGAPSPATSANATDSAERPTASLLVAYRGTYLDVESAVEAHDPSSAVLRAHSIPPATDQLESDVQDYLKLGVVPAGVPDLHASLISLDLTSSPEQATLTSCPSALQLLDLKTRKPVQSKSLPPNPFMVTLQTSQGRWVVSYFKANRSKTCSG